MLHTEHEFTKWFMSRRLDSEPPLNIVLPPNNGLISDDIYYWSITCRPGVYMVLMGVYAPWSRVHFKGRHQPYVRWIFLPVLYSYYERLTFSNNHVTWWDDDVSGLASVAVYYRDYSNGFSKNAAMAYDKKADRRMQDLFRGFVSRQTFASLPQERHTFLI